MAHNQFNWYEYKGRGIRFTTPKSEIIIKKNHVVGIRSIADKYYVTDVENKVTIRIDVADMHRIVSNSKGFTGIVKGTKLRPGVGALDKRDREDGYVRIDSGMFTRGKYDAKRKTLTLEFRNGAVWQYSNVSAKEVMAFEKAKSQGSFFNEVFKGTKESQRMTSLSSAHSINSYGIYEDSDMPTFCDNPRTTDTFFVGDRVTLELDGKQIHWCIIKDWFGDASEKVYDVYVSIAPGFYTLLRRIPSRALTFIPGPHPTPDKVFPSISENVCTATVYFEEALPQPPSEVGDDIVEGERVTMSLDGKQIQGCVVGSVEIGTGDVTSTFGVFTPILPGAYLRVPKVPLTALTRDTYTAVASSYSVSRHGLYETCDLPAPPEQRNQVECNKFDRGSRVRIQFASGALIEGCVVNNYNIANTVDGDPVFEYSVYVPTAGSYYTVAREIPEFALSACDCGPSPKHLFLLGAVPPDSPPQPAPSHMVSESSAISIQQWGLYQPNDLPFQPDVSEIGGTFQRGAIVSIKVMKDGTMLKGCVIDGSYVQFGKTYYSLYAPLAGHFHTKLSNIPAEIVIK